MTPFYLTAGGVQRNNITTTGTYIFKFHKLYIYIKQNLNYMKTKQILYIKTISVLMLLNGVIVLGDLIYSWNIFNSFPLEYYQLLFGLY